MTCRRILILHEGKLLAADTKEDLQKRLGPEGQGIAEIAAPLPALQDCWKEMELIERFDISPSEGEYFRCALTPRAGVDIRPLVFEQVRLHGWTLRELTRSQHTLEDIFVHIIRGDQEDGF